MGHLFRVSTYSFRGDQELVKMINNIRFVDVWMDHYKEYFYAKNRGVQFQSKIANHIFIKLSIEYVISSKYLIIFNSRQVLIAR